MPLIVTLAHMESAGMAVDAAKLAELSKEAAGRAEKAADAAYAAIDGDRVNLASPKQLQEVLFDRLGMPKTKKIATGLHHGRRVNLGAQREESAPVP